MGKGRLKRAFAVAAFAACIWMSGYAGEQLKAREVTDSGQERKVITAEYGEENTAAERKDMTQAIHAILQGATGEFLAGYAVDESFFLWLGAQYGDDVITQLACCVLDDMMSEELWYELTGNSIHVLWTEYCKASGFGSSSLEHVFWIDCTGTEETVIRFTGDFNLAEDWYTTDVMKSSQNGIEDCISDALLGKMREADLLCMNNEFTYSTNGTPIEGKEYTFRADPLMVKALSIFGADLVSLANNHVYDYGGEALLDTLDYLEEAGVTYIGAGENQKEASKIVYYIANGRKIALVSATEVERTVSYTKAASETECGVFRMTDPDDFLRVIEEADRNSDCVIALVHWGEEGAIKYSADQYRLAEQMVAAGADAIIGGHPHRLQGAGYIGDVPVAYSLGNFWFSTGKLYTTVAQLTISGDGSVRLSYLPCIQEHVTTRLLTDEQEIAEFYDYLAAVSVNIGIDAEGNVYDKNAEDYLSADIRYESDASETTILGARDLDGNVIDVVGNLK